MHTNKEKRENILMNGKARTQKIKKKKSLWWKGPTQ